MDYDVIIIGGGITGLTAAYYLTQAGSKVLVIEKENQSGGLLSGYQFPHYQIEKYYHHILAADQILVDLFKQLGLDKQLRWLPASVGYYLNNQVYPLDTPWDVLRFPALSLKDKFQIKLLMDKAKQPADLKHWDQVTAKEWVIKEAGINVYQNFFLPLLKGKYGELHSHISAAWLRERIRIRSNRSFWKGEKLGYPVNGFAPFVEGLVRKINEQGGEIRLNQAVTGMTVSHNTINGVQTDNESIPAKQVVITTNPQVLIPWVGDKLPDHYKAQLASIQYQHTVCLLIGMKQKLLSVYWLNISDSKLPFSLLVEHTNFYQAPCQGEHILYAALYVQDVHEPVYGMDEEEITKLFIGALEEKFGLKKSDILWTRLSKSTGTSPVYSTGFLENQLSYKTPLKGLYLSGMSLSYPERSINDSIKQGKELANIIQRKD